MVDHRAEVIMRILTEHRVLHSTEASRVNDVAERACGRHGEAQEPGLRAKATRSLEPECLCKVYFAYRGHLLQAVEDAGQVA